MSDYQIETKCIQSGWQPENGGPRMLPIYQSTTLSMIPQNIWESSLTWRKRDIFIQAPESNQRRCGGQDRGS